MVCNYISPRVQQLSSCTRITLKSNSQRLEAQGPLKVIVVLSLIPGLLSNSQQPKFAVHAPNKSRKINNSLSSAHQIAVEMKHAQTTFPNVLMYVTSPHLNNGRLDFQDFSTISWRNSERICKTHHVSKCEAIVARSACCCFKE